LVTMVMMFVVGRIAAKVQPKYLIVAGAVLIAASMYQMTNVYGDLGFWYMARSRMLLGVGLPLIFIPVMTASYDGIAQSKTDQASALINAARNTGGSIGVSIVSNVLTHREQFHQSRLVESVFPSSVQYQDTLHRVTDYFVAQGSSLLQAQQQAIQWIGQQVQAQASFLAYMDAFWVLMLISLAAVPLALTLRKVKLGGPVSMGHGSEKETPPSTSRSSRMSRPQCVGAPTVHAGSRRVTTWRCFGLSLHWWDTRGVRRDTGSLADGWYMGLR